MYYLGFLLNELGGFAVEGFAETIGDASRE